MSASDRASPAEVTVHRAPCTVQPARRHSILSFTLRPHQHTSHSASRTLLTQHNASPTLLTQRITNTPHTARRITNTPHTAQRITNTRDKRRVVAETKYQFLGLNGMNGQILTNHPTTRSCINRAQRSGIVNQVSPESLNLLDLSDVLKKSHQVSPNHQAVLERKSSTKHHHTFLLLLII
ncbi:hypothetical protein E2C01_007135 [Portunus trituberculatus]|uniref:Uncharacterized protein n=1 Tax=Portunus trituberculatus TaxID=210409 RepID=A0A5B7CY53_PORTR|nr:hypothetical protein [Portunus trituberculatus]